MTQTIPINIELGVPFITRTCASRILRTIVELLMYQRNQIPFSYVMFRSMINKLEAIEKTLTNEATTGRMKNMHVTKQRNQAKHAFQSAELLFTTMDTILTEHDKVREVMILFGRTIYTAKEAVIINLPTINSHHYGHNHHHTTKKYLQHIAKTLSLSNENFDNMKVNDATNMFLLLKPLIELPGNSNGSMYPLDEFQLPSKCIRFVINLQTSQLLDELAVCCCQRFGIFEEESETHHIHEDEPETETVAESRWHQVNVTVKGFQPAIRNGCQIWE